MHLSAVFALPVSELPPFALCAIVGALSTAMGFSVAHKHSQIACPVYLVMARRIGGRRYAWKPRYRKRYCVPTALVTSAVPWNKFSALHTQLRGGAGAGGASATKRKRQERLLLELLAEIRQDQTEPEKPVQPVKPDNSKSDCLWSSLNSLLAQHTAHKGAAGNKALYEAVKALLGNFSFGNFAGGSSRQQREVRSEPKQRIDRNQQARPSKDDYAAKPAKPAISRPPKLQGELANKVVSYHALCAKLDGGELPANALGALVKAENVPELQAVAKVHGLLTDTCKFALFLWDKQTNSSDLPDGCSTRWVLTERDGAIHMPVTSLGKALPEFPQALTIRETTVPAASESVAVRLTFRKEFMPEVWAKMRRDPGKVVQEILPQDAEARTYAWREAEVDSKVQLIGYAKASKEVAEKLLQSGGRHGIFCEPLSCDKPQRAPVKWIERYTGETPDEYFRRSLTEATNAKVPLACRRGAGACLGLRGVTVENKPSIKWSVTGVPTGWSPQTLDGWLQSHRWKDVRLVQAPRATKGKWTFVGTLPEDCRTVDEPLVYQSGQHVLTINRWSRAKPVYNETWTGYGSTWFRGRPQEGPFPAQPPSTDDVLMIPKEGEAQSSATAAPGSTPVPTDAEDQEAKTPEKPKPKKQKPATDAAATNKGTKRAKPVVEPGPQGTVIWDLGGSGDCGYRAIAAAMALRSGKTPDQIKACIDKLAVSVKAKAHNWLVTHWEWRDTWAMDPSATELQEAGSIPSSPDEYLDAVLRPARWLDGLVAQAIASALQTDILIFQKRANQKWSMTCRVQASQDLLRDPIILLLSDDHYRTIDDYSRASKSWKSATPKGTFLRGAGKSDDTSSFASWLKPGKILRVASPGGGMRSVAASSCAQSQVSTRSAKPCRSTSRSNRGSNKNSPSSGSKPDVGTSSRITIRVNPTPLSRPRVRKKPSARKTKPRPVSALSQSYAEWPCPYCDVVFKGKYNGVCTSKSYHMRTRHPDKPIHLVQRQKPQAVAVSYELPLDQQVWSCPMPGCGASLATLPPQDRLRAIKAHIADKHPDETPSTIHYKRLKGTPKSSSRVGDTQRAKHRSAIAKKHRTHDVVAVQPVERNARGLRGSLFFCKKCYTCLLKGSDKQRLLTCKQRAKLMKDPNGCAMTNRRTWWVRTQIKEPLFAENFAKAMGKTFSEIDAIFHVTPSYQSKVRKRHESS